MSELSTLGFGRPVYREDHDAFRQQVRRFFQAEIEPNVAKWEREGHFPADLFRTAGAKGLLCAGIPEVYGGQGGDPLHVLVLHEEHAYSVAGAAIDSGLLTDMVAYTMLEGGTEAQKREWLPRFATGEVVCELAISEAGAGSDMRGIRTYARRDGSDYVISGQKMWLSNGPIINMVFVAAKVDQGTREKDPVSLFIVPLDTPGVSRSRPIEMMLKSAGGISALFFDEVRVPADALLGGVEGRGLAHAFSTLGLARVASATRAVAASELALALTLDFVKQRSAFGQRIFDFQNTQFKLATVKTEVAVGRVYADRLIGGVLDGTTHPVDEAIGKLWCTEMEGRTMDECLQLFGGAGYSDEYPISKMFAFARAHRIQVGTSEMMRLVIARSL
jgi:long-chain-acyl-CoA dehydrogenase